MRTCTLLSTVLTVFLILGAASTAHARDDLGASGTRLAIGGGAPRFYMTYGHAEEAELFAPIIPELKRLEIVFKREGDGYAVYYQGQRQGKPWPIIRSREEAPESSDELFVLLLGGSVFVPVRKIAELFPVEVRWAKGENLMTLSPDPKRPKGILAVRPKPSPRPPGVGPKSSPPPTAMPVGGHVITAVEMAQDGAALRLTVHTSGRIVPTTLNLKDPPRLVLDFPGARWAEGLVLPEGAGEVRRLRNGYFQPPSNPNAVAARLVLELNSPQTKILGLKPGETSVVASVGHTQSRMARNVAPPTEEQRIRDAILRRARPPRLPVRHLPPLRPLQDGFDTEAPIREPRVGPVVGNSLAGRVICVDAGHGGRSTGAVGAQYLEKDLCLKICLELQRELEARGARVVMTRTDDSYSSPEERCVLANAANAEIFISIHLNASKKRNSASGTETYWFTPHSFPLAQALHARMQETVGKADRGVKNYSWIVCHATTMPSVLLEVAFISNKNDERLLASRQFQQNLAAALAEGVIDYFTPR